MTKLKFAQLVPRDLSNRCILSSRTSQIHNYDLLVVLSSRFSVDEFSKFTVDVVHSHDSSLNRPSKLTDLGCLLHEIGDVLGFLQNIIGTFASIFESWGLATNMLDRPL
jgi:hypothetical protein